MKEKNFYHNFPRASFIDYISKLRKEEDNLIIVEGIKDKIALEFWGIRSKILSLRRPISEFVLQLTNEFPKERTIILLMDRDKEGKEFHKKLKTELKRFGYKVNSEYWLMLNRFHIVYIEGLNNHFFRILKKQLDEEIFLFEEDNL